MLLQQVYINSTLRGLKKTPNPKPKYYTKENIKFSAEFKWLLLYLSNFFLVLICITPNWYFDSHYNKVRSRKAGVIRESRTLVHKIYVWLFRKLRQIYMCSGQYWLLEDLCYWLIKTKRVQVLLLAVGWELCESLKVFDSNICPAGCHEGAVWPHILLCARSYFLVQPTWKTNTETALETATPWLLWRYLALVFMSSWNQCKNF